MLIRQLNPPKRCEVCHQSDVFEPETERCLRCGALALTRLTETICPDQFTIRKTRFQFWVVGLTLWIGASCLGVTVLADMIVAGGNWLHWVFLLPLFILGATGLGFLIGGKRTVFTFDRLRRQLSITRESMVSQKIETVPFREIQSIVICETESEGLYDVRLLLQSEKFYSLTELGMTSLKECERLKSGIERILKSEPKQLQPGPNPDDETLEKQV